MPMRVRWVQIGEITAQEDTRLLRALRKPLIPGVYTQGGYQSRDVRFGPKVGKISTKCDIFDTFEDYFSVHFGTVS